MGYAYAKPTTPTLEVGIPRPEVVDGPDVAAFEKACNVFYNEFFWFPGHKPRGGKSEMWVNSWDDNGKKEDMKDYPGPALEYFQSLGQSIIQHTGQLMSEETFSTVFGDFVMSKLFNSLFHKAHTVPISDGLHFARGIHSLKLDNTEWHVGIPVVNGKPDLTYVRKIWWILADKITALRKEGNYSVSILELRLVKAGTMMLSTLNTGFEHYIAIEVLGLDKFRTHFVDAIVKMSIELEEKDVKFLFHWPKMWPEPIDAAQIAHVGAKFPAFKSTMQQIVTTHASLEEYQSGIFSNIHDPRLQEFFTTLWK